MLADDSVAQRLVETQELPPNRLVASASATDLPDTHDTVSLAGESDGVYSDDANIAVVPDL